LYVSILVFEDFYDPVCWTESGIYIHRSGNLIGKHATVLVGWGTDSEGRDYWLLFNGFGDHWQNEGYFKVMRGDTALQLARFGAYAVDFSEPTHDSAPPLLSKLDVTFAPQFSGLSSASREISLLRLALRVDAGTSEHAQVLLRVEGEANSAVVEARGTEYTDTHVLEVDLLPKAIMGQRAKMMLWGVDKTQNSAKLGSFSLYVPPAEAFTDQRQQASRMSTRNRRLDGIPWLIEGSPSPAGQRVVTCPPDTPLADVRATCQGWLHVVDGERESLGQGRVLHSSGGRAATVTLRCEGEMELNCRPAPTPEIVGIGSSVPIVEQQHIVHVDTKQQTSVLRIPAGRLVLARLGALPDRYNFDTSNLAAFSGDSFRCEETELALSAGVWFVLLELLPACLATGSVLRVAMGTAGPEQPEPHPWVGSSPLRRGWQRVSSEIIETHVIVEVLGCGVVYWTTSAELPDSLVDMIAAPLAGSLYIDASYVAVKPSCPTFLRAAIPSPFIRDISPPTAVGTICGVVFLAIAASRVWSWGSSRLRVAAVQ